VIEDLPHPAKDELDLSTVLGALADPGRLATVQYLAAVGEACCSTIQEAAGLDCSKSTMSHHLKVLRETGITRTRVDGVRRYVSLRHDEVDARFPGLLDAVVGSVPAT
jgi:DNA-binding transcriptional ArsR family regulator